MIRKVAVLSCLACTLVMTLLAVPAAHAFPDSATACVTCHPWDASVITTVSHTWCNEGNSYYEVTVSDTYELQEGWAVFKFTPIFQNAANGYGSMGTFSIPAYLYTAIVYGVSNSSLMGTQPGGSSSVLITPHLDCQTCTDADGDLYYLEGYACGTQPDCNDQDPDINPGSIENCTDGIDNDCDNLIDTADPNAVGCPVECTDGDGDNYSVEGGECGPVDCNDSDPDVNPGAVENCFNSLDDDCDGYIDFQDTDCSCEPSEVGLCSDGYDNDCDGKVDCSDRDCRRDPACSAPPPVPEVCDDGIDNDGDGKVDCADRDCRKDPACS